MAQAKQGDTVQIHYTGKYEDGTIFDTSVGREPLEFKIGEGQLIPGFEAAVVGMSEGEEKTVKIPSDQAYGPRQDEMVVQVPRSEFPEGMNPEIGQQLAVQQPDGQVIPVLIVDVTDDQVTLDANHPLAGEDLTFEIQVLSVKSGGLIITDLS